MLSITQANLGMLRFLESLDDSIKIKQEFNEKTFRVDHTPLTYRQINSLSNDKIIKDRSNDRIAGKWRKFNFKEVIFLDMVKRLKDYGLTNKQLIKLRDSIETSDFQKILTLSWLGEKTFLTIKNDGSINYYDKQYFEIFSQHDESFIFLDLTKILKELYKKAKVKSVITDNFAVSPMFYHMAGSLLERVNTEISKREEELLKILRNDDYRTLTIKKLDNKQYVINAEIYEKDAGDEEAAFNAIKNKDFVNIQIIKRNGKVATYKLEDIYRI